MPPRHIPRLPNTTERHSIPALHKAGGPPAASLIAVAGFTLFNAVIAVTTLDDRSLWIDEVFTTAVAGAPADRFLSDLSLNGGNMSLYLVFMRAWLTIADSDWWIRLPSVFFATASIPAFFALAHRFVSAHAATAGTASLALSAPLLLHAQEARAYSLAVLLTILSWSASMSLGEKGTRRSLISFVVLATALTYAHVIALLVVGVQLLWLLHIRRRHAIIAALSIGILISPQLILAFGPNAQSPSWIPRTSADGLLYTLRYVTGTTTISAAVLVAGAWCAGAVLATREGRPTSLAPVLWLVVPVAGLLVVSTVSPMFLDRYLLIVVPAASVLLAMLWDRAPTVGPIVVLTTILLTLPALHSTATRSLPDWSEATGLLIEHGREDEVMLLLRSRQLVEHYWDQEGRPSNMPAPLSSPMEWGPERRTYEIDMSAARSRLRAASGAWIVERVRSFALGPERMNLIDQIRARWPVARSWTLDGEIRITHFREA